MRAKKNLLIIAFGLILTNANAQDGKIVDQKNNGEILIVNIWVNGVDYNNETLTFIENNKRYIECKALSEIGIRLEKTQHHLIKRDFCSLDLPGVSVINDDNSQSIKINFPADYFLGTKYNLESKDPEKANLGGFINYSLFYSKDELDQDSSILTELGVFKDYWLFKNNFLYRNDFEFENVEEPSSKLLRVSSTLEVEFPENFLTLTIGDAISPFNVLNNSFRFGGLSIGSNYTSRPDFVYWNIPSLSGSASLPSTIDLLINGQKLYRDSVTPGYYNLPAGAIFSQAGDAKIIVEDILGNRTVRSFPVYINNQLLKPKLNEYNFSLGKLRYNYDYVDDDYRDFFTKLYFRRGVTYSTTLGVDLLYNERNSNVNLLWTQGVSKYFLIDSVFSLSKTEGEEKQGYAGSIGISRNSNKWSFGLENKYFTKDYKYLSDIDFNSLIKNESFFYISFNDLKLIDGLNLNYNYQSYYKSENSEIEDYKSLSVQAVKMLTQNLYTDFGFFKDFGEEGDYGFNISFSYNWENKGQISLTHNTVDERTRVSFSRRTMSQNGFDYVLGASQRDDEINYNVYGLLKTSIGNFQLSHDEYENTRYSQATFDGGLVWLGNKVALTKYADNAFALVNVNQHPGMDIYRSANLVGSTNKKGYIFVHDLVPYIHYDISFDHNQLEMEESFEHSSRKLIALNQRGYKIDFPIYKTKRIAVKLKDLQQNNLIVGSEVLINGLSTEPSFVDSDGIVYLYLLKAGVYNLKVKTQGGRQCQAQLVLNEKQFQNVQAQTLETICK